MRIIKRIQFDQVAIDLALLRVVAFPGGTIRSV
jgi:hypothetical protein